MLYRTKIVDESKFINALQSTFDALMSDDDIVWFKANVNKLKKFAKFVFQDYREKRSHFIVIGSDLHLYKFDRDDKQKRDAAICRLHDHGLTQSQIGLVLNVSQSLVSKVINKV